MNWFSARSNQFFIFVLMLLIILVIRLFSLTVVQGEEWSEASESIRIKNIYTAAPRGLIKDRYGRVLAGNQANFVVQITSDEMKEEEINPTIKSLITIFEKNGDIYTDKFPIVIENGEYKYIYQKKIDEWLNSQEIQANSTAIQAFNEIRRRNNISDTLDKYEAQTELQTVYNVFPPISVKNMVYSQDLEKITFLQKHRLEEELTAKEAFEALLKKYKLNIADDPNSNRKILIFRDAISSQGYRKYVPFKVASNISSETIVEIEEMGNSLKGVEIIAEPVRIYPYGSYAAHILGYLGQIEENDKQEFVEEKGYSLSDMIGKDGIEMSFEGKLKGTNGVKSVEVNAIGRMVQVIKETPTKKGKDIYLSIDIDLQKTVADSLEKALEGISKTGVFESEWGNYYYSKRFKNANAGAAVVMKVDTGEILAMESYPSYDPNLFSTGISNEAWEALQTKNPRDPLSPVPLYNIATRTYVQPGSIFKMVTGTAAVDRGLDPKRKLYDGGAVTIGNKTFGCSIWNSRKGSHGLVDLVQALEVSCNYYFFDAASGYDYYRKTKITSEPMGIEVLMEYAKMYGLGVPSGIEIKESVKEVPSEAKKISTTKANLKSVLMKKARLYFLEEVADDREKLEAQVDEIVSWVDENPVRSKVYERLAALNIKEEMLNKVTDLCKYTYFNQAKWTTADTLNIAIGQGENAYTPLQMARYVSTIANGGTLFKATLLKGVESEKTVKDQGTKMSVKDDKIFNYLQEGMRKVVAGSRGTARGTLGSFPIPIAAKTGTAERAGKIQPPDEVEYIKKNLSKFTKKFTFAQVEDEMTDLMIKYPEIYTSKNVAVRQAVINLSDGKITEVQLDAFKSKYDNFSWFVAFAPADNPEIAIAVLIVQGGSGNYAAPVVKEIVAKYMELDNEKREVLNLENYTTQ